MKENIKFVIKSAIIATLVILAFSCKKHEPEVAIFDGRWVAYNKYNCPKNDTLVIEFFKRIGKESKRANKYCVVSGFGIFYCASKTDDHYFFSEFKIESSGETLASAVAKTDDGMTLEIKSDVMTITAPDFHNGVKLELKRVK